MADRANPHPHAVRAAAVTHFYGTTKILDRIDVDLEVGRVLALLGPSGCGKTTLLKLVAGLMPPSEGVIRIAGEVVADPAAGVFLPPERRGLAMVFQDYALWPHLTVGGNVAFPLEMQGVDRRTRAAKVAEALARVGLAGFEQRPPSSLSGGQQQRVAIARAIVGAPKLVLFDEPLSNLDRELRETLAGEIAALVRGLGLTAIYVTHDQSEAFALADEIAVMRAGRIAQRAAPEELVDQPATPEVAELLNLGPIGAAAARSDGWWLADGSMRLAAADETPLNGATSARVLLARRAFALASAENGAARATVLKSQFRGDRHLITARLGSANAGTEIHVLSERKANAGETVGLAVDPKALRWFPT